MNKLNKRDIGIDVIKCIAALLITNSHFDMLYPNKIFATGGSMGNSLFFFASGFLLFLKPMGRFDNWYKKRINRIYPTIFAWAILSTLLFDFQDNIIHIILYGGEWFITAIMVYYIIIYLINQYMRNHLLLSWGISSLIVLIWYIFLNKPPNYDMYGATFFKWSFYFLFMLMGAIMGKSDKQLHFKFALDLLKLVGCVLLFYIYLLGRRYLEILNEFQIFTVLPLLGITYYFYKVSNSKPLKRIYKNKIGGAFIKIIGGLCLEIYMVQTSIITTYLNEYFPLNLIVNFSMILISAYILRCVSRIFSQIFKDQNMNWQGVFSLY